MKTSSILWALMATMALSTLFLRAQPPVSSVPSEPPIKPPPTGLSLPSIIGDHMVLQAGGRTPLWGWAKPGEKITIKAASTSATAVADVNGKWRVDLEGLQSSSNPIVVTISGKSKTITLSDVLVGDVWFCSGQSNMEIPLSYVSDAAEQISKANRPLLRLFLVFNRPAVDAQVDCRGEWKVCTPENAKDFSAVAYLFGEEISDAEHVPVGLIGAYSGGSWISAWISQESLESQPESKEKLGDPFLQAKTLVPKTERSAPGLSPREAQANSWADMITSQFVHDDWYDNRGGKDFSAAMKEWHDAVDVPYNLWRTEREKAKALGETTPRPPALPPPPSPPAVKEPRVVDGRTIPTMLFNGMVAPILPYAIKGVLWYQGESDRNIGTFYRTLFPQMIADWRRHWGQGDFPFVFAQLAGFSATDDTTNNNWSLIQEAQLLTLSASPQTAMAVANDIGDLKNVHPHDKIDLARRLALAAEHLAYHKPVVYSGPIFESLNIDGAKIKVKFRETGSGLKIGLPPAAHLSLFPEELSPSLNGFQISGDDMNFVSATAVVEGTDEVLVSNDQVKAPVAVRYSWGNVHGNLYNNENLPASPFRTDLTTPAPSIRPLPKPKTPPAPLTPASSSSSSPR